MLANRLEKTAVLDLSPICPLSILLERRNQSFDSASGETYPVKLLEDLRNIYVPGFD